MGLPHPISKCSSLNSTSYSSFLLEDEGWSGWVSATYVGAWIGFLFLGSHLAQLWYFWTVSTDGSLCFSLCLFNNEKEKKFYRAWILWGVCVCVSSSYYVEMLSEFLVLHLLFKQECHVINDLIYSVFYTHQAYRIQHTLRNLSHKCKASDMLCVSFCLLF